MFVTANLLLKLKVISKPCVFLSSAEQRIYLFRTLSRYKNIKSCFQNISLLEIKNIHIWKDMGVSK